MGFGTLTAQDHRDLHAMAKQHGVVEVDDTDSAAGRQTSPLSAAVDSIDDDETARTRTELLQIRAAQLADKTAASEAVDFIKKLSEQNGAQLKALSIKQIQWIKRLSGQYLAKPVAAEAAPSADGVGRVAYSKSPQSTHIDFLINDDGIAALKPDTPSAEGMGRVVYNESPQAAHVDFLDDTDLKVAPSKHNGREVYGWFKKEPKGERMLFCYDKSKRTLLLTDAAPETREMSVLKMLQQAGHLFGEAFELTGSDEFKQYARAVADAHGITIPDRAHFEQAPAPGM